MKNHFAGLMLFLVFYSFAAAKADRYEVIDTTTGISVPVAPDNISGVQPVFRADIQSTSTDWEAVSGLRLSEYRIKFTGQKTTGTGWEMYYLDGFPCYGYAQYTRIWVSQSATDGQIMMNCVRQPAEIKLAYRKAKKDDYQKATDGILSCKLDRNMNLDLSKCEKKTWSEYQKE